MEIKRLEIKGFKSFPDKTVLEFKPGISGIVGPNGCGKSNVFEAIRWSMGEQRARTLRGKKMEDIIFNGSESRKPVGMAEVKLVLSNSGGDAPPSMADYEEIMICRRLFRDGESQYEINNIPCRLSDIIDFFLDTGVGKNSYAIIEQGRVDMVVASKPEDRRTLIEEAAGISRYKSRKEAALKKLELTRQNLTRINDVIAEVKRQSAALKRQASRAERYRKLSERLRALDLNRHAYKSHELQGRIERLAANLAEQSALLMESEATLASSAAHLERDKLKALETERSLKQLLEARHAVDLELTSMRGRIERDRETISQLKDRKHRIEAEKSVLQEKLLEIRDNHDAIAKNKSDVQVQIEEAGKQLKQALSETAETDRSLNQEKKALDSLKEDIFRVLQETSQQRNRRESLTRRETEIATTLARNASESEIATESMNIEKRDRERISKEAHELATFREEALERKERWVAERQQISQRIAALRSECATAEKKLAGTLARLESLEEMRLDYSSYDEGVRFLMNDAASRGSDFVLGPLAELLEAPPEFHKALSAALGERLGHVVVASTRHGMEAANRLEAAAAGRSTFIPLLPRCDDKSDCGPVPPGLKRLQDVVTFKEGCERIGEFLLGRCFVVEDMAEAVNIWELNGAYVDLVTKNGEFVSRYGEIAGGSLDTGRTEIFEKRQEIENLRDAADSMETFLSDRLDSLKIEEETSRQLSARIEETEKLINEFNLKEIRIRKDLERLDSQIANSERRLQVLGLERDRLEKERAGISEDCAKIVETIEALEAQRKGLEGERDQVSQRIQDLTQAVGLNSNITGEMRVKLAQLEERGRSLEREHEAASETLSQHERRISNLDHEFEHNAQETKRLETGLSTALVREQELMRQHQEQAGKLQELGKISELLADSVRSLEETTTTTEKRTRELRERTHSLEMELVRERQMLEGLVEKILERYHMDPRTLPAPDAAPDDNEIADIRAKMEAMGEVNLAAIAESKQIEERLGFLREQAEDLQKAVDSLYATISAINKTTKERFRAAFDRVNEKFQEIFPFLFKGGEARLELTDEEDLLETGVDIMARPPGKRIQNMDLLSGGEKALTAVALIFAIFLTRPSPFCLLDEVDAPLDDANLVRFNEMLRKLSDNTQFLVITHNKRSMETADSLYGITMEEPGTSRVVSVEFMDT
jgi:chromosome segregation protein